MAIVRWFAIVESSRTSSPVKRTERSRLPTAIAPTTPSAVCRGTHTAASAPVTESTFSASPPVWDGLKMSGLPCATTHSDIEDRTARSSGSISLVPRRAPRRLSPEAPALSAT